MKNKTQKLVMSLALVLAFVFAAFMPVTTFAAESYEADKEVEKTVEAYSTNNHTELSMLWSFEGKLYMGVKSTHTLSGATINDVAGEMVKEHEIGESIVVDGVEHDLEGINGNTKDSRWTVYVWDLDVLKVGDDEVNSFFVDGIGNGHDVGTEITGLIPTPEEPEAPEEPETPEEPECPECPETPECPECPEEPECPECPEEPECPECPEDDDKDEDKDEDKEDDKDEDKEDDKDEDKEDDKDEDKEDDKDEDKEDDKDEDKEDDKDEDKEDDKVEDKEDDKVEDKEDDKVEDKEDKEELPEDLPFTGAAGSAIPAVGSLIALAGVVIAKKRK